MTVVFAAHAAALGIVETVAAARKVRVFDGPQPIPKSMKSFVVFGCDDVMAVPGGVVMAVDNGSQQFLDLGALDKVESFRIFGVLVLWHGRTEFAPLRDEATVFFADLEAALKPSPGHELNGPSGVLGHSGLVNFAITRAQHISNSGAGLHVQFAIDCTTHPNNNI